MEKTNAIRLLTLAVGLATLIQTNCLKYYESDSITHLLKWVVESNIAGLTGDTSQMI